jgi:CIC family chloride channel protein
MAGFLGISTPQRNATSAGQRAGLWARLGLAGRADPADPAAGGATIRHRRRFGERIHHVPVTLRALVRADELGLVVLAAGVGLLAGVSVTLMSLAAQFMHVVLFALPSGVRLSGAAFINPLRALIVPSIGGLLLGISGLFIARYRPRRVVDAIEANALYGGRMSLNDSLVLVLQTIWSNGVGASVGLEAGYAQIGSALGSRLGRIFRLRRSDLRLLVGCGAGAAIGAAFNAPLTGAFYAFELVIGAYTLATLAPVLVASITAVALVRFLIPEDMLSVAMPAEIEPANLVPVVLLGVLCALVGIVIMRGVTLTEDSFRRSRVPVWLRPLIGGLIVGLLGLMSPQVMSSGHAAVTLGLESAATPIGILALLLVMKSIASAVSIGSGFRGGLFFASLLLGALLGKLFGGLWAMQHVMAPVPIIVCAMVGMSGMATAIVGGPLTMSFLALEMSGSLPLTVAVVGASIVSALTVRRTFGYSFATWRFHLRGEVIRSAVDIGWIQNLTVARMMRREVRSTQADDSLESFRRNHPLGSRSIVVAVDSDERYVGMVLVAEAHTPEHDGAEHVRDILHQQDAMLLPQMTVKEAVELFETAEADTVVVVDTAESRRVIGTLSEQYTLRRYSEELDRRRREISGE